MVAYLVFSTDIEEYPVREDGQLLYAEKDGGGEYEGYRLKEDGCLVIFTGGHQERGDRDESFQLPSWDGTSYWTTSKSEAELAHAALQVGLKAGREEAARKLMRGFQKLMEG